MLVWFTYTLGGRETNVLLFWGGVTVHYARTELTGYVDVRWVKK